MKSCPYCAEPIQDAALVCRWCNRNLGVRLQPRTSSDPGRWLARLVAGSIAVLFLLLVGRGFLSTASSLPAAPVESLTTTPVALSGCQEHIELKSAAYWVTQLGGIPHNGRINVWQKPDTEGKGRKVGELLVGSRAVILQRAADGTFFIQSPLDGSRGWVSDVQVARTLWQDVDSRKPCRAPTSTR